MAADAPAGPLRGTRVLDLTDALAAYAGRLLGDLGADVVRIEAPGVTAEIDLPPHHEAGDGARTSLFERFVNAGKRSVELDLADEENADLVEALVRSSDVLIESAGSTLAGLGWSKARLQACNPELVHVVVSPYGSEAEDATVADDLVLLAAGGLAHLGGYPDAGPVAVSGLQSHAMASIYAAVAALTGLLRREHVGGGASMDVSAQECVAQAMEDSVVGYALTGEVRASVGERAKEAGTGIYRCADGYISMVAGRLGTAPAWEALTAWMREEDPDGMAELSDPAWSDFHHRQSPEGVATFQRLFERFAAGRTRQELYAEAQERRIALSPVNDLPSVLQDRQLAHRGFFVTVEDPDLGSVVYPGLPYRIAGVALPGPRPAPRPGADTRQVLVDELGADPARFGDPDRRSA